MNAALLIDMLPPDTVICTGTLKPVSVTGSDIVSVENSAQLFAANANESGVESFGAAKA